MTTIEAVEPAAAPRTSPSADAGGFDVALADALGETPAGQTAGGADGTITFGEMISVLAERGDAFASPTPPQPTSDDVDAQPVAAANGTSAGHTGDHPAEVPAAAWQEPSVRAASAYLGTPYLWGGTDPNVGLDCSGFLQRAYADVGVDLPRVSADQSRAGTAVTGGLDAARPGDLVYWAGQGGSSNHIGLYLGEGKMMHAPRRGEDVQVASVRQSPPDAIRRVT